MFVGFARLRSTPERGATKLEYPTLYYMIGVFAEFRLI